VDFTPHPFLEPVIDGLVESIAVSDALIGRPFFG
jgi:hypothetical protein